jgi:DNA methyltransferase 1-associated protein 1
MIVTNFQGVFRVHSRYASRCDRIEILHVLTLTKDLKDRYYSICRKLVRTRPWNGDEPSKIKLLGLLAFEKGTEITALATPAFAQEIYTIFTEREITRKQYLRSLEGRTPEQIAEEEALYLELKRLEQTERQFKKDRDDLLRTLLGVESGLSDIQLGDDSSLHGLSSMPEIKKSKKKTGGTFDLDSPLATPSSSMMQPQKRAHTIKNVAYGMLVPFTPDRPSVHTVVDAQHCITRIDLSSQNTKTSHQAAALRSYKLPIPKQAMSNKVSQTLSEHGINVSRLVMPTRESLLHLESLIEATTLLLETKKNVDRVEHDIRVMKAKVLRRDGQLGGGESGEVPMDVDQEVVADDDDAGVQPGRSARKKNVSLSAQDLGTG